MQYARAVVPAAREFVHGAGGGVPNQGVVMSYVYAWYAVAGLARTAAARDLKPTFPYWQADPGGPWRVPPDGQNPALTALSAHPLPEGIRGYAFYGNQGQLDPHDQGTWAGGHRRPAGVAEGRVLVRARRWDRPDGDRPGLDDQGRPRDSRAG